MKKLFFLILLTISASAFSQEKIAITNDDYQNQEVEMADTMRSNGKIYIVVAVVLIILFGMLGYLTVIDRKLTKLEQGEES